jgi:hypothetical protein
MRAVTRRWRLPETALPETARVGLRFAHPTYKDFSLRRFASVAVLNRSA